jgi:hypothetical protein
VETAATGKIENRTGDGATMLAHLGLGRCNIRAVEHQQGAALSCLVALIRTIESAIQPLIGKGAVVGAVIDKLSAKYGLKEGFGSREIPRCKFYIVQSFMGVHAVRPPHHQHRWAQQVVPTGSV